jgi:hypothetical protein
MPKVLVTGFSKVCQNYANYMNKISRFTGKVIIATVMYSIFTIGANVHRYILQQLCSSNFEVSLLEYGTLAYIKRISRALVMTSVPGRNTKLISIQDDAKNVNAIFMQF